MPGIATTPSRRRFGTTTTGLPRTRTPRGTSSPTTARELVPRAHVDASVRHRRDLGTDLERRARSSLRRDLLERWQAGLSARLPQSHPRGARSALAARPARDRHPPSRFVHGPARRSRHGPMEGRAGGRRATVLLVFRTENRGAQGGGHDPVRLHGRLLARRERRRRRAREIPRQLRRRAGRQPHATSPDLQLRRSAGLSDRSIDVHVLLVFGPAGGRELRCGRVAYRRGRADRLASVDESLESDLARGAASSRDHAGLGERRDQPLRELRADSRRPRGSGSRVPRSRSHESSTGRVSHWSSPVSFTAGGPAGVVDVLD